MGERIAKASKVPLCEWILGMWDFGHDGPV